MKLSFLLHSLQKAMLLRKDRRNGKVRTKIVHTVILFYMSRKLLLCMNRATAPFRVCLIFCHNAGEKVATFSPAVKV